MSMFDDNRYCWRETYLVMLDGLKRPTKSEMVLRLHKLNDRLIIKDLRSTASERLESLIVIAPNDGAAVEIQYHEGEEVAVEFAALADELERHEISAKERKKINLARGLSAKIALLHFEQIQETPVKKQDFPTKLSFPRYSPFIQNLAQEMKQDDEPDEFDLAERLDPNTLIRILKLVTQLTEGIAFDPASGVVL
ncbi:MAG: hypothetical protein FWD31_05675 [Planctomycetaceae bacterium]|nr:hypothetical protein [Planctomycetaceae bacterium]